MKDNLSAQCDAAVKTAMSLSAKSKRKFDDAESYNDTLQYTFSRTVYDVAKHVPQQGRILEIGAFTGVVSIALKQLGYDVVASDIPFVLEDEATRTLFDQEGIEMLPHDLSVTPVPAVDASFDAIVFCEVLEHLNFNPLPLVGEFNRLLKASGVVYCATPNLASIKNRLYLAKGKGFYNPVEHLEWNLTPETGMSVGLHWREYTKAEMEDIFRSRGLEMVHHTYCNYASPGSSIKQRLVRLMYSIFPAFMHGQAAVFRKTAT